MTIDEITRAETLAAEHWAWLESVLAVQREMEKKLFIDSFVHGFKHGIEYRNIKQTIEGD